MMTSMTGRLGLSFLFLLSVNLLSGWIAVVLRFPSLWGNTSGIFGEYATPLPFAWGFIHWLTMLPLALLIAGMPVWDKKLVVRFRIIAAICLGIALFIEIDWGYGKLNKIPFTLYAIVDLAVALFISLGFFTPWRWIGGSVALLLTITAGRYLYLNIDAPSLTSADGQAAVDVPPEIPFFSEENSYTRNESNEVQFYLSLRDTVQPGVAPLADEICRQAERRFEALLARQDQSAGYNYKVYFMAHPWFEPNKKYIYPAGSAFRTETGAWQCEFTYPEPARSGSEPAN